MNPHFIDYLDNFPNKDEIDRNIRDYNLLNNYILNNYYYNNFYQDHMHYMNSINNVRCLYYCSVVVVVVYSVSCYHCYQH